MSDTYTWKLLHGVCIATGILSVILSIAGFVLAGNSAVSADDFGDETPTYLAWASFPFHAIQAIANVMLIRQFSKPEKASNMSIIQKIHKQKNVILTAIIVNASLVVTNFAFLIAAVTIISGVSAGAIAGGAGLALVGLIIALVIDSIWMHRLGKDTQLTKAEVFIQPTEYQYQPV